MLGITKHTAEGWPACFSGGGIVCVPRLLYFYLFLYFIYFIELFFVDRSSYLYFHHSHPFKWPFCLFIEIEASQWPHTKDNTEQTAQAVRGETTATNIQTKYNNN